MARLRDLLAIVVARWPRQSLAIATTLARVTRPLGLGPDFERFRRLVPELPIADPERERALAWASALRSRTLAAALSVRRGRTAPYPAGLICPELDRFEPPLILASPHLRPALCIGALLERLPADVLVLHTMRFPAPPGVRMLYVDNGPSALHAALRALREGGLVVMLVDGGRGSLVTATMFGRRIGLSRGAFTLARLSGVPLVPVAPRWQGEAIEILTGEPIAPTSESDMAAQFARWWEEYLTEHPDEIDDMLVRRLLESASASEAPSRAAVAMDRSVQPR
jgi:hypothetical protein